MITDFLFWVFERENEHNFKKNVILEKILSSILPVNKNKYLWQRYYYLIYLEIKKINNINHILISGFSLQRYGLIFFLFNEVFPYPGNVFTVILLLLNMRLACFVDVSFIRFLLLCYTYKNFHPIKMNIFGVLILKTYYCSYKKIFFIKNIKLITKENERKRII